MAAVGQSVRATIGSRSEHRYELLRRKIEDGATSVSVRNTLPSRGKDIDNFGHSCVPVVGGETLATRGLEGISPRVPLQKTDVLSGPNGRGGFASSFDSYKREHEAHLCGHLEQELYSAKRTDEQH